MRLHHIRNRLLFYFSLSGILPLLAANGVNYAVITAGHGAPFWPPPPEAILGLSITLFGIMGILAATMLFANVLAKPISRILEADAEGERQGIPAALIPHEEIPRDEFGEIMRSRNRMLSSIHDDAVRLEVRAEKLKKAYTDLKNAQDGLSEAAQMASIGSLAAGLAHELNNPLCGVLTYLQLLLSEEPEDSERHQTYREMERAIRRCAILIQNLRDLSRYERDAVMAVNCLEILEKCLSLLQAGIEKQGVKFTLKLPARLPPVRANPGRLAHLFFNLITTVRETLRSSRENALCIAAREEGGFVAVEIRYTHCGAARTPLEGGPSLDLAVYEVGRGGLSLSVSHLVARQLGGRLEADTDTDGNAVLTLKLPVVEKGRGKPSTGT